MFLGAWYSGSVPGAILMTSPEAAELMAASMEALVALARMFTITY
jgi:hypothetical protein